MKNKQTKNNTQKKKKQIREARWSGINEVDHQTQHGAKKPANSSVNSKFIIEFTFLRRRT